MLHSTFWRLMAVINFAGQARRSQSQGKAASKDKSNAASMEFDAEGSHSGQTKITTRSRAHQQAQEGAAPNPGGGAASGDHPHAVDMINFCLDLIVLSVLQHVHTLSYTELRPSADFPSYMPYVISDAP